MNDRVIYTSLTGGYEVLKQPLVIKEEYDYICFSNDLKETRQGIWEIRPIPWESDDLIRLSRYVKLNPHVVFDNYKYSIWIDANIQILDDLLYKCIDNCVKYGYKIALPKHPFGRKDLYEEAAIIYFFRREKLKPLTRQVIFLYNEGYPSQTGLFENNIIFRQHNDERVRELSKLWWTTFLRFTHRDQMSFCYSAWKVGISPNYLLPEDVKTTDKSPHFFRINHNSLQSGDLKSKLRENFILKPILRHTGELRLKLKLFFPKFYFQHILKYVSWFVRIK